MQIKTEVCDNTFSLIKDAAKRNGQTVEQFCKDLFHYQASKEYAMQQQEDNQTC